MKVATFALLLALPLAASADQPPVTMTPTSSPRLLPDAVDDDAELDPDSFLEELGLPSDAELEMLINQARKAREPPRPVFAIDAQGSGSASLGVGLAAVAILLVGLGV
ncbi:Aste57867_24586 [Aphanomyces stellatus]|uniref:Aste57867_24586 protein n=1 Tax=Aphanomyces stellatus TaxID=120398 RepID=A0A485LQV8_9STRA|nr:hypothetical protein As57867_024508 [Aphanomyces stellatus]VFU01225.1 Aste57867_24586 [Aphanomyces stellatus]